MSARCGQHKKILCASLGFLSTSLLPGAAIAEPLRASITQYDVAKGWIPSERLPLAYWEMLRNPTINMTEGDDFYSRFVHYEQNGSQRSPYQFVLESDNLEVRVS